MKDLIESLTILEKYAKEDRFPTACEHNQFYVNSGIELDKVSKEDLNRLYELDWFWCDESECFSSYRFGSC